MSNNCNHYFVHYNDIFDANNKTLSVLKILFLTAFYKQQEQGTHPNPAYFLFAICYPLFHHNSRLKLYL